MEEIKAAANGELQRRRTAPDRPVRLGLRNHEILPNTSNLSQRKEERGPDRKLHKTSKEDQSQGQIQRADPTTQRHEEELARFAVAHHHHHVPISRRKRQIALHVYFENIQKLSIIASALVKVSD